MRHISYCPSLSRALWDEGTDVSREALRTWVLEGDTLTAQPRFRRFRWEPRITKMAPTRIGGKQLVAPPDPIDPTDPIDPNPRFGPKLDIDCTHVYAYIWSAQMVYKWSLQMVCANGLCKWSIQMVHANGRDTCLDSTDLKHRIGRLDVDGTACT